ncbi:MAG: hypothetical protein BGO82_17300 [Devosia sp. 67-54]|uniref:hypothetical protein n=1 Tax=unclassified Devosia TaxID=196773 RepID=UPI00096033F0|nr:MULTISPECIES: hypothetical protein [unclassified Devosia]MBN9304134.1 hypothetical protein [Devosia sp.]OJX17965.1 MAG: hypothetical protein BGO82_17300 [Devosia sp. 67-54]
MSFRIISLPGWLVNLILAAAAYLRGREDEVQRQHKNTDALEEHYDEIANSNLSVDDAFDRLQRRAEAAARLDDGAAGESGGRLPKA